MMKLHCRKILDLAAVVSISLSRRIFMERDCQEWPDCWLLIYVNYNTFFFFKLFSTCRALFCLVCGQHVSEDSPHVTLLFVYCIVHACLFINHNWLFFSHSTSTALLFQPPPQLLISKAISKNYYWMKQFIK